MTAAERRHVEGIRRALQAIVSHLSGLLAQDVPPPREIPVAEAQNDVIDGGRT